MIYTKEKFKELWEANENGSGITFNDIADCAVAWGISSRPKTRPINLIRYPNPASQCEKRIMIDLDKACEWLDANVCRYASLEFPPESDYAQGSVEVESLLKAFKQAMKEGEK